MADFRSQVALFSHVRWPADSRTSARRYRNRRNEEKIEEKCRPDQGEPGAHQVGTGVGAAGGAVTGAALGAAIGGPIGATVGTVVGGIAAAYGAHGVAEAINPTIESDKYWREHHAKQPFVKPGYTYDDYAAAYRAGYEGFHHYPGKPYEEIESDLALDYERNKAGSALPWGSCPVCGACSLGQSKLRYRPALSRPRNPQRNLIVVAAVYDRRTRKICDAHPSSSGSRGTTTWLAERRYRSS